MINFSYFNPNLKKAFSLIIIFFALIYLASCGIVRPVDARKVSPNDEERIKQNQKEGRGISFGNVLKKNKINITFTKVGNRKSFL